MTRHTKRAQGITFGVILVVIGLFYVLDQLMPDVKLWPYFLIGIGVVFIIVNLFRRGSRED